MSIKFRNEVTMRPIETVMPYYRNAKLHDEEQIKKIAAQIATVGWDQPIVVDTQGIIIKGHGRLAAAKSLGLTEVPVIVSDISEKEARLARIADNKVAESGWDNDMLAQELADLKALGESLDLSAFETKEVDEVLNEYDRKTNPRNESEDEVPEVKETTVKLGDLYQLGNHRLLCGDATKKEDVERLMGGEKAEMVFTDPPYGVSFQNNHEGIYKNGNNSSKNRKDVILGDSDIHSILGFIPIMEKYCDGPAYVFCGAGNELPVLNALKDVEHISTLIWKKQNRTVALNANYKPCFEMFYYLSLGQRLWSGNTAEWTVWEIDGENKNEFHPTQKPIKLIEKALNNHTSKTVLDLFLGSGSTLIACEKTNRKCMGCEIDPHYVQVAINRWEKYTGQKAVLLEAGPQAIELPTDLISEPIVSLEEPPVLT